MYILKSVLLFSFGDARYRLTRWGTPRTGDIVSNTGNTRVVGNTGNTSGLLYNTVSKFEILKVWAV